MEEIGAAKIQIREDISQIISTLSESKIAEKTRAIENRLFEFANFLESKIALLYVNDDGEVPTENIIKRSYDYNKIVVLPAFDPENRITSYNVCYTKLLRNRCPGIKFSIWCSK